MASLARVAVKWISNVNVLRFTLIQLILLWNFHAGKAEPLAYFFSTDLEGNRKYWGIKSVANDGERDQKNSCHVSLEPLGGDLWRLSQRWCLKNEWNHKWETVFQECKGDQAAPVEAQLETAQNGNVLWRSRGRTKNNGLGQKTSFGKDRRIMCLLSVLMLQGPILPSFLINIIVCLLLTVRRKKDGRMTREKGWLLQSKSHPSIHKPPEDQ